MSLVRTWLTLILVTVSWHFPTVFLCIGIPLVTSCISSFSTWDGQCCLCLSSQCLFSYAEALSQPTPWPAVAAFPFIIQSPTSPLHAIFCCLALRKASVQLTPSLCALPITLIHFHCSATQFPPLILCSSAVPWPPASHQLDVVSDAAYASSSSVLLFSKCSVISPSQLSLLVVLRGPPVPQVHIVSN